MNDDFDPQERQLAAPFEGTTAPASVRRWGAGRAETSAGHRWDRRRAAQLSVPLGLALVIGSVAGALGLRAHRSDQAPGGGGYATPAARNGASMAWDADLGEVVLFGGRGADDMLGDTWGWDGRGWRQLHPRQSPPARGGAAMAWDAQRHRLVLFGGLGATPQVDARRCPQPVEIGPPQQGGPLPAGSPLPAPRSDPPSQLPALGRPLPGGQLPAPPVPPATSAALWPGPGSPPPPACAVPMTELADTWTFDGDTWTQQKPPTTPRGVAGPSMAWDSQRQVLVLAGQQPLFQAIGAGAAGPDSVTGGATGTVTGTVTGTAVAAPGDGAKGIAAQPPSSAPAPPASDVPPLISGGPPAGPRGSSIAPYPRPLPGPLAQTWSWDGRDWTVHQGAPLAEHAAVVSDVSSGRVLLVEGSPLPGCILPDPGPGGDPHGPPVIVPPSVNVAPPLGTTPQPSFGGGVAGGAGGFADPGNPNAPSIPTRACVEPPLPASAVASSAIQGRNRVLSWEASAWRLVDPGTAGVTPGAAFFALASDGPRGVLLLDPNSRTTWRFAAGQWTRLQTGHTPGLLPLEATAYDPVRDQVVAFGLAGKPPATAETWIWNGSDWARAGGASPMPTPTPTASPTPSSAPSPAPPASVPPGLPPSLVAPALAWDTDRSQLVLYGVTPDTKQCDRWATTWTWDRRRWTQVPAPAGAPAPLLSGAVMAWDPAIHRVVMVGSPAPAGADAPCGPANDGASQTWTWDGHVWAQPATGPLLPPGGRLSMAYDESHQQLILTATPVGGVAPAGDTFTFDGTRWSGSQRGPGFAVAGVVWDGQYKALLAYGGTCGEAMKCQTPGPPATSGGPLLWGSWDGRAWNPVTAAGTGNGPSRYATVGALGAAGLIVVDPFTLTTWVGGPISGWTEYPQGTAAPGWPDAQVIRAGGDGAAYLWNSGSRVLLRWDKPKWLPVANAP